MTADDSEDPIRPHVAPSLDDRLADAVREHVRVPPDRLPFGDRLRIALEEYDRLRDREAELEAALADRDDRIDELESALADREERIEELERKTDDGSFLS